MLEFLFGWIQDLSVYLITAAALLYAVPGEEYRKYIRFYSGLVLVLLLITPVLRIAGIEHTFLEIQQNLEGQMKAVEENMSVSEKMLDFLSADPSEVQKEADSRTENGSFNPEERKVIVEEIRIGK